MRRHGAWVIVVLLLGCATTRDPGSEPGTDPTLGLEPQLTWPDVPAPPGAVTTAGELLTEILRLVELDRDSFPSSGPLGVQRDRVETVVNACLAGGDPNHDHTSKDLAQHAWGVHWAWSYAWAAWNVNAFGEPKTEYWRRTADELEHLESGLRME